MKRPRWFIYGAAVGVLMLLAAIAFRSTLIDIYLLLTNHAPQYAQAIPGRALLVLRTNVARIALKADLGSLAGYPQVDALKGKASRLYPRVDELLSDPLGETGIQLTGSQYLFIVPEPGGGFGLGILFGIRNREKAARFLSRVAEGAQPQERRTFQMLSLSGTSAFAWNKNFGMFFATSEGTEQTIASELDGLMNPVSGTSFESLPHNRDWIESDHDLTGYCSGVLLESAARQTLSPYGFPSVDSMQFRFSLDFGRGILKSVLNVTGSTVVTDGGIQNRKLLSAVFSDSSLLIAALHLPVANVARIARKNMPGFNSRENALAISGQDVLDALSGDMVLEVVDVKPGKDLRGRIWPFPQFGLAVGLKNAAVIKKGSQYLLDHQIARHASTFEEIHFGEYELYYTVRQDAVYMTNKKFLIQRPWKTSDGSGFSSKFSLRTAETLSLLSPYVDDHRARDMMNIAGNAIDAIAITAEHRDGEKEIQMRVMTTPKEKNSVHTLTEMVLRLSERYFQ